MGCEVISPLHLLVDSYLGFLLSWAVDTRTEIILRDCDYNHDGVFTADDFRKSKDRCMPSQISLCLVQMVCKNADKKAAKEKAEAEAEAAAVKSPRWWKKIW